jgi:DNA-binding response OmpR family regulator
MFNWFKSAPRLEDTVKAPQLPEIKKKAKILIIDDRPDSLPIQFLTDEGYTVEVWEKVKTLDALEQGRWHIIVLDISGVAKHIDPKDDGFTVLKHIKKNDPNQLIIACSAEQFDPSRHDFFKLADETLAKPVTPDGLKEKVDRLLRRRFDARTTWKELSAFLKSQGVSESEVKKLEKAMVQSIQSGTSVDIKGLLADKMTDKALELAIHYGGMILLSCAGG